MQGMYQNYDGVGSVLLKEDYKIQVGDHCIKFLGEDDVEYILEPGIDPRVGTGIVIHPVTGEVVTAGHEVIQVGEQVIIVPLDTGDWAALKPAWSQETNCKPIIKWVHETTNWDWVDGDGYPIYRSYDIHLSEPFYRNDHDMNINAYFMKYHNGKEYEFFQNRFPWGGVTIGFGSRPEGTHPTLGGGGYVGPSPDVYWYWDLGNSPYATISGGPQWDLGDTSGINGIENDNPHYCYMDALNENDCNPQTHFRSPLPGDVAIEYIHVQVRTYGSSYFAGFYGVKSFLQAIDICRQVPTDCEIRCYGGRNVYPPIPPYDIVEDPEDWDEVVDEIW